MKRFLGPMCAGFLTEVVMFTWLNASSQGGWSGGGLSPVPLMAHFPAFLLAELPLPAPLFMATLFALSAAGWSFVWYGIFRWAPTIQAAFARFRPRTVDGSVKTAAEPAPASEECTAPSNDAASPGDATPPSEKPPVELEVEAPVEAPAKGPAGWAPARVRVAEALRKAKEVAVHGRVTSALRPVLARVSARVARLCPVRRG